MKIITIEITPNILSISTLSAVGQKAMKPAARGRCLAVMIIMIIILILMIIIIIIMIMIIKIIK